MLGLLRQHADLERIGGVSAKIRHLGELSVAQRRAVLGVDLDCHAMNPTHSPRYSPIGFQGNAIRNLGAALRCG